MRRFRQFLRRRDGVIAVEFAFVAPVMLGMFFGLTELALALGAKANVINLTSAGADLIAQENAVTTADMSNVFSALSAMMYPYSITNARITITSLINNGNTTTGKVAWSCTQGGTARAASTVYIFPTTAQGVVPSSGNSVIMSEVSYSYNLPFNISIPGVLNLSGPYVMTDTFYAKPRRVAIIAPPTGNCP